MSLKQIFIDALRWPRAEERARSEALAKMLVHHDQVEKWRLLGVQIKRSCVVLDPSARFCVHISGSSFCRVEVRYTHPSDLVVYVGNQSLDGTAPGTIPELVDLVDREAQKVLLSK